MDALGELQFQEFIDGLMSLDERAAFKLISHHNDLEMGFGTGRYIVHRAFVDDFQMSGGQRLLKFYFNIFLHAHDMT